MFASYNFPHLVIKYFAQADHLSNFGAFEYSSIRSFLSADHPTLNLLVGIQSKMNHVVHVSCIVQQQMATASFVKVFAATFHYFLHCGQCSIPIQLHAKDGGNVLVCFRNVNSVKFAHKLH